MKSRVHCFELAVGLLHRRDDAAEVLSGRQRVGGYRGKGVLHDLLGEIHPVGSHFGKWNCEPQTRAVAELIAGGERDRLGLLIPFGGRGDAGHERPRPGHREVVEACAGIRLAVGALRHVEHDARLRAVGQCIAGGDPEFGDVEIARGASSSHRQDAGAAGALIQIDDDPGVFPLLEDVLAALVDRGGGISALKEQPSAGGDVALHDREAGLRKGDRVRHIESVVVGHFRRVEQVGGLEQLDGNARLPHCFDPRVSVIDSGVVRAAVGDITHRGSAGYSDAEREDECEQDRSHLQSSVGSY